VIPVVIGSPVAFVSVTAEGMPRFGVTKTGFVAKTAAPVPVSSESRLIKDAEVAEPAAVVRVPVALVPTTEFGAKELPKDEQVGQVMLPRASSWMTPLAETATVPVAFGKVQVRAAVKSDEVIVPVNVFVAVVLCGRMEITSELAVVEAKEAALVVDMITECAPLT
jgi:hypothetical protein